MFMFECYYGGWKTVVMCVVFILGDIMIVVFIYEVCLNPWYIYKFVMSFI